VIAAAVPDPRAERDAAALCIADAQPAGTRLRNPGQAGAAGLHLWRHRPSDRGHAGARDRFGSTGTST